MSDDETREREESEEPLEATRRSRELLGEAALKGTSEEGEPDVFLNVPVLKVDELGLDVDELAARVSLRA